MSELTVDETRTVNLTAAWEGIKRAKPGIRIRDAAKELGVNEAQLLATKTGKDVIRLKGPWPELLKRLPELGRVISLTRNDSCILEHKGPFQKVNVMGSGQHSMATVIGPIEYRTFFGSWSVAFSVTEEKGDRVLRSIQVFDKAGDAVIKVYLQEEQSDEAAWMKITEDFRDDDQGTLQAVTPFPEAEYDPVDAAALIADWSAMKDTHDFFGMLKKHKAHRYEAIEATAGKFTYQVDARAAAKQILENASGSKLPIMIFAGNRGNIQIHQGKVRTIRVLERGDTWLNVLDPDFNMHMKQNDIKTAWVVKKPTEDGDVTSVELFDAKRNLVAQFFGLRKPGIPERTGWRELIATLPAL